jgi:transcriptional regulator
MYQPSYFREQDRERLYGLIKSGGFGLLVSNGPSAPLVTHLPFILDRFRGAAGVLQSHMARANSHWTYLRDGDPVVGVFPGPDAYISPQWYREEPDVPTWNYRAAHAHGTFHRLSEPPAIRAHLEALVSFHEGRFPGSPMSLLDMDAEMVAGFQAQVVAFEIHIVRIEGAAKLSQDKLPADRHRIASALAARGAGDDAAVAADVLDRPSSRS